MKHQITYLTLLLISFFNLHATRTYHEKEQLYEKQVMERTKQDGINFYKEIIAPYEKQKKEFIRKFIENNLGANFKLLQKERLAQKHKFNASAKVTSLFACYATFINHEWISPIFISITALFGIKTLYHGFQKNNYEQKLIFIGRKIEECENIEAEKYKALQSAVMPLRNDITVLYNELKELKLLQRESSLLKTTQSNTAAFEQLADKHDRTLYLLAALQGYSNGINEAAQKDNIKNLIP